MEEPKIPEWKQRFDKFNVYYHQQRRDRDTLKSKVQKGRKFVAEKYYPNYYYSSDHDFPEASYRPIHSLVDTPKIRSEHSDFDSKEELSGTRTSRQLFGSHQEQEEEKENEYKVPTWLTSKYPRKEFLEKKKLFQEEIFTIFNTHFGKTENDPRYFLTPQQRTQVERMVKQDPEVIQLMSSKEYKLLSRTNPSGAKRLLDALLDLKIPQVSVHLLMEGASEEDWKEFLETRTLPAKQIKKSLSRF